MPVRYCVGLLLLGLASNAAFAQDAQTLINKNLEARGGAAALAAIRNVTFKGRSVYPGDFELDYSETRARAGGSFADRVDFSLQGLDIIQAYDGRDGWKVNPLEGRKDAEKLSADEIRALADSAIIDGPLLASRRDGSRVTYLGREDFDGTLTYKLKVAQTDGDEFVYWLDPTTFLEIKVDETRKIRGAQQTTETELGDYEKVAGVYFPMSVETWPQGADSSRSRTVIASSSSNTDIPPDYFHEPANLAASDKAEAIKAPSAPKSHRTDARQGKRQ